MNELVPVIAGIVGLLMYALSANPKVAEIGKILFAACCFALMFAFATRGVHLF